MTLQNKEKATIQLWVSNETYFHNNLINFLSFVIANSRTFQILKLGVAE